MKTNLFDFRQEFRVFYETIAEIELMVDKIVPDYDKPNPYLLVFGRIYPQLLDIFLALFVSFSIFPAVMANIESTDHWIPDKYFGPVFCFLVFNLFTFVGTLTAERFQYPTPELMIGFTSTRVLLIPVYLFLNYRPKNIKRRLIVVNENDLIFLFFNIVLGFSNGHMPALSLMYAPQRVASQYASIAGMMSSFMILIGILSGLTFALVFPQIV